MLNTRPEFSYSKKIQSLNPTQLGWVNKEVRLLLRKRGSTLLSFPFVLHVPGVELLQDKNNLQVLHVTGGIKGAHNQQYRSHSNNVSSFMHKLASCGYYLIGNRESYF